MSNQAVPSSYGDGQSMIIAERLSDRSFANESQLNSIFNSDNHQACQLEAVFDANGCVSDIKDVS